MQAIIFHRLFFVKIFLFSILSFCCTSSLFSQSDTSQMVKYSYDYVFVEGLYLNFDDFKNNAPISYENIIIEGADVGMEFFESLNLAKKISYFDEFGIKKIIEKSQIWGYCKNRRPYVMWNNEFRLLPYIGSISHFVANITVYHERVNDPFYDPYSYYSTTPNSYYTSELVQMIIDMETGEILTFNQNNVGALIKRDPTLYEEYTKLRKRKKRKLMFYYIRRYNDSHILYFPKL